MRREPIPDAALRKIVEYAGEDRYHPQADIASELLALREAARVLAETSYNVAIRSRGGPGAEMLRAHGDALLAVHALLPPLAAPDRALLPKEPA